MAKKKEIPQKKEESTFNLLKKWLNAISQEDITDCMRALLEIPFWPTCLKVNEGYFRSHDDNGGNKEEGITVYFTCDGDAFVKTDVGPMKTARFRMPIFGGGNSPRVRAALLILALAIKEDNEKGGNIEPVG
jgi:hypothetical protein